MSATPVTGAEQHAREIAQKQEILLKIPMENAVYSSTRRRFEHDEDATVPQ
jgi:hypothetical protein